MIAQLTVRLLLRLSGIDQDQDGQVDGLIEVPITCGQGVCQRNGLITCTNGVEESVCVGRTPTVMITIVFSDNDCDGDEGCYSSYLRFRCEIKTEHQLVSMVWKRVYAQPEQP